MHWYYRSFGVYIDTGNLIIRTNFNKLPISISNKVAITTWSDSDATQNILFYDTANHTINNNNNEVSDLSSVEGGYSLDNVKRFGRINAIGNIFITEGQFHPSGHVIPKDIADGVQAMYKLPSDKELTTYVLYGKDKVSLLSKQDTSKLREILSNTKDKSRSISVFDFKAYKTDSVMSLAIKPQESTHTIDEISQSKIPLTLLSMDHDTFTQIFFPREKLPDGADPLNPEEYEKFRNIRSNTAFLPFKKDGKYYALVSTDQIVHLGDNIDDIKGVYHIPYNNTGTNKDNTPVALITDDSVRLYKPKSIESDSEFRETEEIAHFKGVRGFGVGDWDSFYVEDEKGVLHIYEHTSKDTQRLVEGKVYDYLIKGVMLKNTLSGFTTPESVQQYLTAICS